MRGDLDDRDRAILYELQRDASQPAPELADKVGTPPEVVEERVTAMEDQGIIQGYHAAVDYDAADVPHYYCFRCSARISQRERLAEEALDTVGVLEVLTLMTGYGNVLVLATGDHKNDITGLASELDRIGLDVEDESLIRQHSRQPYETFRLSAGGVPP